MRFNDSLEIYFQFFVKTVAELSDFTVEKEFKAIRNIYIYNYIYNAKRESMKDYKYFFYQYSKIHVFTRQSSIENCYQRTNYNYRHTHRTKPSRKNSVLVLQCVVANDGLYTHRFTGGYHTLEPYTMFVGPLFRYLGMPLPSGTFSYV